MKSMLSSSALLAALFITTTLTAGCAGMHEAMHRSPESTGSQAPGATTSGSSGGQMPMTDLQSMCDAYRQMMSAKTPEERQAMMDERMKNVPPEMRQKHMAMMEEKCKG